jgi:hypothetical protein
VPNVNAPKNWNSQDGLVMLPTTEEKKRSELIDELLRIDEPLIAWAVITASRCYFGVQRLGKDSYGLEAKAKATSGC